MKPRIHLSVPHMSGHERGFVADAFESNWLSTVGPNVEGFECELAARLGGNVSALAVSSGTAVSASAVFSTRPFIPPRWTTH